MIELREKLNELIINPRSLTTGKHFPKKVYIYDETLRDGEQMPGVAFTSSQKMQMARFLSDMGVDVMMAAFPISSQSDRESYIRLLGARKRGELRKEIQLICIARANRRDIDMIVSLTKEAGVAIEEVGILILSTTSDLHMKYKLGRSLLTYSNSQ